MNRIRLGERDVGEGCPCVLVAELGINHNGSVDTALRMIDAAKVAGADMVKFQKRTIDLVYTFKELYQPRPNPFGPTNGDLKRALELSRGDFERIDTHCRLIGIPWFASAWDTESVAFLERFGVPAHKIPSALLTDHDLVQTCVATAKPLIVSTGMSNEHEVRHVAHELAGTPHALLACTAAYPCPPEDLNLSRIPALIKQYGYTAVVGWSGHEVGLWTSLAAVALGAKIVERHFTLDRSAWGSDQAASLEPHGFAKLVEEIRTFERAWGTPEFRCLPSEEAVKRKLRTIREVPR